MYNAGNFEQWAPGHPESIAKQLLFSAIFDWLTTVHLYHILVLVGNLTSSDTTLDSRRWVWLLVYIIFKVIKRNTAKHSRCSARLNSNQDPFDKRFPTRRPHPDLWSFFIHIVHLTLFYSITSYNGSEDYNLCPPNQEFLIESFVKRKKCLKKGKKMTVSAVKGRLTGSGITCPIVNPNGNGDNVAKQKI